MILSTNRLSIVYTFAWEYISISSHIVVCHLFNITSVHKPERNKNKLQKSIFFYLNIKCILIY